MWTISAAEEENTKTLAVDTLSSPEYNLVLHDLFVERATLLNTHLTNLYDGRDIADTTQELSTNSQKLADIVEVLSNETEKDKFVTASQEQIKAYELYATGLRERDNNKLELAQQILDANTTDFGKVIHTVFPSISLNRAATLLEEQNGIMITIMTTYATNENEKEFDLTRDATDQASSIADELVLAIQDKKEQRE